jgi:hypothetical protein
MEDWKADETATVSGCEDWCTAYLWIVPAKVGGTWKLPQGELNLKQTFQMLSGTLKSGKVSTPISGKVNGDQISFTAGKTQYTGRVNSNSIEGTAKGGTGSRWSATRVGS